jgi:hypothetical protein
MLSIVSGTAANVNRTTVNNTTVTRTTVTGTRCDDASGQSERQQQQRHQCRFHVYLLQGRHQPLSYLTRASHKAGAGTGSMHLCRSVTIDPVPGRPALRPPCIRPDRGPRSASVQNRHSIVTNYRGMWGRSSRHDRVGNHLLEGCRPAASGVPARTRGASTSFPTATRASRANAGSDFVPVFRMIEAR